jgi:ABC-type Mn2+/Zn2+ transport system ATPase subunit
MNTSLERQIIMPIYYILRRYARTVENAVHHAFLSSGLDHVEGEWKNMLSGGENQRLGFARLFYRRVLSFATFSLFHSFCFSLANKKPTYNISKFFSLTRSSKYQFAQPRFAVLDEASSAINPDQESLLYQVLFFVSCALYFSLHLVLLCELRIYRFNQCLCSSTGLFFCKCPRKLTSCLLLAHVCSPRVALAARVRPQHHHVQHRAPP